jgi:DNA polymerase I-like protein with 3'-5' exonuclease and polymerase domains
MTELLFPDFPIRHIPTYTTVEYRPPVEFPSFAGCRWLSLDLETSGLDVLRGDYIVGVVLKTDQGTRNYWPIRHQQGMNCDETQVLRWLKTELKDFHGDFIGANSNLFDAFFLMKYGIVAPHAKFQDIQWAEALLDELAYSYSLEALGQKWMGTGKKSSFLTELYGDNVMEHFAEVHPAHASEYALTDIDLPPDILTKQKAELKKQGLHDLYNLECRLTPMLNSMRMRGIRVDVEKAAEVNQTLINRRDEKLQELHRIAGFEINIAASADLVKMCEKINVQFRTTAKGNPSFTNNWMKRQQHPAFKLILAARKYEKARNPFVSKFILEDNIKGRIHTQFHPLRRADEEEGEKGTVTGRFSCTTPNLQQIPRRDPELGPLLRSMFLPDEGKEFFANDYSQIEFRLIVNAAALAKNERGHSLRGAKEALRRYQTDPKTDFHNMVMELTKLGRDPAKTINFGLAFSMGAKKLANELGMVNEEGEPTQQAYDTLQRYHDNVPFVKEVSQVAMKRAEQQGFIRTILGRRSRFDLWEAKTSAIGSYKALALPYKQALEAYGDIKRAGLHRALNRYTQGSSADITKAAMVAAWESGLLSESGPLQVSLTVHDELAGSVAPTDAGREALAELKHIMETTVTKGLVVPVIVESKRGSNWSAAH